MKKLSLDAVENPKRSGKNRGKIARQFGHSCRDPTTRKHSHLQFHHLPDLKVYNFWGREKRTIPHFKIPKIVKDHEKWIITPVLLIFKSQLKSWPFRKFRNHRTQPLRREILNQLWTPQKSASHPVAFKKNGYFPYVFWVVIRPLGDMTKDMCLVQTFESSRFFPENFMAFNSFHGKFLGSSKVASFQNSVFRAIVLESLNFRWCFGFLSFTPFKVKALGPKFKSNRDWWNLPKSPNSSRKKNRMFFLSNVFPSFIPGFLHCYCLMVQKFG